LFTENYFTFVLWNMHVHWTVDQKIVVTEYIKKYYEIRRHTAVEVIYSILGSYRSNINLENIESPDTFY